MEADRYYGLICGGNCGAGVQPVVAGTSAPEQRPASPLWIHVLGEKFSRSADTLRQLNEAGRQGWHIVGATQDTQFQHFVLERPAGTP